MKVSEYFYSIQGEGEHTGKPAVFLRLQGCNLLCGKPSQDDLTTPCEGCKWVCDTIAVWRQGKDMTFEELYDDMAKTGCIKALIDGAHLVITGGEPMLQQEAIHNFLRRLSQKSIDPYVEIETNGTIAPLVELDVYVDRYNVSPKLSNSGNHIKVRYNKEALTAYNYSAKTIFKFVVLDDNDVKEIFNDFITPLRIINEKIYLMPGAYNREELYKNGEKIAELCKEHHFTMSSRLHVEIWDRLTGV